jgi:zinc protease
MKKSSLLLRKGEKTCLFEKELQTPNAITVFVYHAPMKTTLKNNLMVSMLQQLMSMLYTESVREDEGGAYGVPVQGGLQDYPEEIAQMLVQLPTAPEKRERMTEIVYKGIDEMCNEGPNAENLQKVKEYMHRKHAEDLKTNAYWMGALVNDARYGRNFVDAYDATVDAITLKDIQKVANTIFKSGNKLVIGMTSPMK